MDVERERASERLVRKLLSQGPLPMADIDALHRLPMHVRCFQPGETFVEVGDRPQSCCLVLEGYVYRYKVTPAGTRQISAIHIPGDMPDLQSLHLEVMDHSLSALTSAEMAFIPHAAVRETVRLYPALGDALWKLSLVDGAMFREWLTSVGRQDARTRVARLLCELFVRLSAVGLAEKDGFVMPLTQSVLGDALGLSTVHVNRVLQELRGDELISSEGRFVRILDWFGLREAGEFDALYLHLGEGADLPGA